MLTSLFTLKLMVNLLYPLTEAESAQRIQLKIVTLDLNNKLMSLTKN